MQQFDLQLGVAEKDTGLDLVEANNPNWVSAMRAVAAGLAVRSGGRIAPCMASPRTRTRGARSSGGQCGSRSECARARWSQTTGTHRRYGPCDE